MTLLQSLDLREGGPAQKETIFFPFNVIYLFIYNIFGIKKCCIVKYSKK